MLESFNGFPIAKQSKRVNIWLFLGENIKDDESRKVSWKPRWCKCLPLSDLVSLSERLRFSHTQEEGILILKGLMLWSSLHHELTVKLCGGGRCEADRRISRFRRPQPPTELTLSGQVVLDYLHFFSSYF